MTCIKIGHSHGSVLRWVVEKKSRHGSEKTSQDLVPPHHRQKKEGLHERFGFSDKSCRSCPAEDNLDTWTLCSRFADSDPAGQDGLMQSVTLRVKA